MFQAKDNNCLSPHPWLLPATWVTLFEHIVCADPPSTYCAPQQVRITVCHEIFVDSVPPGEKHAIDLIK